MPPKTLANDEKKAENAVTKFAKDFIAAEEKQCSDTMGSCFKFLDTDKILVFLRKVSLKNVQKVDTLSKNDLYFEVGYEIHSKPDAELFAFRSEVKNEAGANADWELLSNVHFQTHRAQFKTNKLIFKCFDKNNILSDVTIGETTIDLAEIISKIGYDTEYTHNFEIKKAGAVTGKAAISLYFGVPFNWITCGLHAPKLPDFSCGKGGGCSFEGPSCANCGGCCHLPTCGTCHCPSGEKCFQCHAPQCGCGKCGIPTCSMACPCHSCGNCGVLPCACKQGACHFMDCLGNIGGCWESMESTVGIPISFEKAHIYFNSAKLIDLPNKKDTFKNKELEFTIEFLDFQYKSKQTKTGEWILGDVAFLKSSTDLHKSNLRIKVFEIHSLTVNLIAEGEISLFALLQAGYHHEIGMIMPLGKTDPKTGLSAVGQLEVKMVLKSEHTTPASGTQETSTRKKRESILYESNPETLHASLNETHFTEDKSLNLSKDEADKIIQRSIKEEDALVGYQVRTNLNSKYFFYYICIYTFYNGTIFSPYLDRTFLQIKRKLQRNLGYLWYQKIQIFFH